jgi:hypothetical protein
LAGVFFYFVLGASFLAGFLTGDFASFLAEAFPAFSPFFSFDADFLPSFFSLALSATFSTVLEAGLFFPTSLPSSLAGFASP